MATGSRHRRPAAGLAISNLAAGAAVVADNSSHGAALATGRATGRTATDKEPPATAASPAATATATGTTGARSITISIGVVVAVPVASSSSSQLAARYSSSRSSRRQPGPAAARL